jgi:hypothetical protein
MDAQLDAFVPCRPHDCLKVETVSFGCDENAQCFLHRLPPANDPVMGKDIIQQSIPIHRNVVDAVAVQTDHGCTLLVNQGGDKSLNGFIRFTAQYVEDL